MNKQHRLDGVSTPCGVCGQRVLNDVEATLAHIREVHPERLESTLRFWRDMKEQTAGMSEADARAYAGWVAEHVERG